MQAGDVVRPIVDVAGLDCHRLYRVAHVEQGELGYTLAFVVVDGPTPLAVENAHLVMEVVRTGTVRPRQAALN